MTPTPPSDEYEPTPFEWFEYDNWVRPWIQAVKLVDEYRDELHGIQMELGVETVAEGITRFEAEWLLSAPPPDDVARHLFVLARRWKLPGGAVEPETFEDYGVAICPAVIRLYRRWLRPATAVMEVSYYDCVEDLGPIFEGKKKDDEEHRKLSAMLHKAKPNARPLWPVLPIVRADIDLEQPNSAIRDACDALRLEHGILASRRPTRSRDDWSDLVLGFQLLQSRRLQPRQSWRGLYRRHFARGYDDERRERVGRDLRRRAERWVERVRHEVLDDETALPWPFHGYAVIPRADSDEVLHGPCWFEPKRHKGEITLIARSRRRRI